MKYYYLGVDVGNNGAFAVIDEDANVIDYWKYKKDSLPEMEDKLQKYHYTRAFVEKAQPYGLDGGVTAFTKGVNYGMILALLSLNRIEYHEIHPRTWQTKILGRFKTGDSKRRALEEMTRLHPRETFIPARCRVVHDGVVDALAIAHYARRYGAEYDDKKNVRRVSGN